ncbi:hypothetical protein CNMCM6069_006219 [Aspergillus lentulus]|nr:hypothetical protein CNMCM6069_006219 [Aspergillus lentulus]KAF4185457.1 hypothetical protein CNMCM7927_006780 [Aspergillus lentulus]
MSLFSKRSSRQSMTSRSEPNNANSTSFRGGRAPGPNDVFIAVMGVTGSGKSSFISLCSGRVVKVGHQLEACTTTVDVYAYDVSSTHTVYLIDTPGFDDTNRSDTQVLREIAGWLGASYKNKILLHGIIYLHRITDIRMQGSAKKNLIMFRQLCGQDALKKVILVTTMWDKVPADEGARREAELINTPEFWGWMLGKGSSCHRHNNMEASARSIVARLANHKTPITTDLQRQLVDENKSLDQTSAGRELQGELLKEKEKWARERWEIEEQMKAAIEQRDREAEQMMREERDRYTKMIKKVENDTGALRSTMNNLLAERDKREAKMAQQMKQQQARHEAEMKRLSERQRRIEKEKEELEKQQRRREMEDERRRKREQEQEQARLRQVQLQPQVQRQTQAQTSSSSGFPPYSVTIANSVYMCIGPKLISSNDDNPKRRQGSEFAAAASLGDIGPQGFRTWIAGYSDGRWCAYLNERGQNSLELCALGPGDTYFARWRNGRWSSWASDELNAAIRTAQSNGNVIKAIALGYGGSYIISYGNPSNSVWTGLSTKWNLKGHYPELSVEDYLRTTSITAVSLDMTNGTDFILVYRKDGGDSGIWIKKNLSSDTVRNDIADWWKRS